MTIKNYSLAVYPDKRSAVVTVLTTDNDLIDVFSLTKLSDDELNNLHDIVPKLLEEQGFIFV